MDMVDLLIRGVPEELHDRYRRLAQKHHRSLPAETLYLIERAVAEDEQLDQRRAVLARINERRHHLPPAPSGTPNSLSDLREDRER
jgi:plasmid stability protein